MALAIKVENLSKAYRLGQFNSGALSQDLQRWLANARGKEDPTLKIGERNDRTVKSKSNYVLSLNDINFEIPEGETVGIIGKNGAGKSTLLKLLSRITSPTRGTIKTKGRIASLLEVGTGFHPELTGRENVFLNGAILGMRRAEIKRKFDEIVDFAGVARYIDTPVKRYSSGMHVRLGFAVAAYLESEILIVDEVLAVGDAEFQKRCLGKMDDINKGEGRTILFVSHNMSSVLTLCRRGIILEKGEILMEDEIGKVVGSYHNDSFVFDRRWQGEVGDDDVNLLEVNIDSNNFYTSQPIELTMKFKVLKDVQNLVVGFHLLSDFREYLAYCVADAYSEEPRTDYSPGVYTKKFIVPPHLLSRGRYKIICDLGINNVKRIVGEEVTISFELLNDSKYGELYQPENKKGFQSLFRPNWEV